MHVHLLNCAALFLGVAVYVGLFTLIMVKIADSSQR